MRTTIFESDAVTASAITTIAYQAQLNNPGADECHRLLNLLVTAPASTQVRIWQLGEDNEEITASFHIGANGNILIDGSRFKIETQNGHKLGLSGSANFNFLMQYAVIDKTPNNLIDETL